MVKQELKQGYKQTEVGIIPQDWEVAYMINYATLKARIGWQALTTKEYLDIGEYYLVTGTDFIGGRVNWTTCHFVDKWRYCQDKNIQLKESDVLVTKDGTIGKVGYVKNLPGLATLNSGVFVIRISKKEFNPLFLYYILTSEVFDDFLAKITAGSTITHLYQKDFTSFKLPRPGIKEQTAIAQILSDTDLLIEHLNELIIKKKNVKQGTMQQLLSPKDTWEKKKLTEVVNYIHGKAHEKKIVENGKYVVVNSKFISTEGSVIKFSNMNYCPTKKGDILTVLSDLPNGKALAKCYLVDANDKYTVNQRICIWRTKEADPRFLFYLLNRNKYFLGFDDGVSQTHILNNHIQKCEILIPTSKIEQENIGKILSDMDIEIKELKQKKDKYIMLKKGMMQELLTGRIRINVTN